jgi:hypothetical protein
MSEWIDFAVYATLIVLVFVLLPRHGRQFVLPMLADRNPEWLVRNPDLAARFEQSRWFLNACYLWAAVSFAVLLGMTLDVIAPPFGTDAPKWRVLQGVSGTFLIVGMLAWGACSLLWFGWLGKHVPLAETRRAALKPRAIGDYLSFPWRVAVEVLTALHLGAWVVIGALGLAAAPKVWWSFAFFVGMSALFAVFVSLTPRRRPGYLDRVFGDAYRQSEIRAAYTLRLWPAIAGSIAMAEQITGADLDRLAHLLVAAYVCVLALLMVRLRPAASSSGGTSGHVTFASDRRSPA